MRHFNKFLAALLISTTLATGAFAAASTIPLQTGPVDPSGIRGTLNTLINSINGYLTGASQFGSIVATTLGLTGSTSGTTTLAASATASGTATFPAATDTVVELTQTQTLTNKTLTAPTINGVVGGAATSQTITTLNSTTVNAGTVAGSAITGPAPTACGATCSVTAANAGTGVILLNQASGSTVTLPGATGTGNVYKMMISVATTSAAEKVLTNPTTDAIIGTAIGENAGTAKVFVGNASTYHSIQMPFTGSTPSGGFIGDSIVCTDVATATWQCQVIYQAGTTPTTPYSASTS